MNGVLLRTSAIGTFSAFDLADNRGHSFDDAAEGADDRVVDLRRVDAQVLTGAAGLCGADAPTYVALVHEQPARTLALIAFKGADAPGATPATRMFARC